MPSKYSNALAIWRATIAMRKYLEFLKFLTFLEIRELSEKKKIVSETIEIKEEFSTHIFDARSAACFASMRRSMNSEFFRFVERRDEEIFLFRFVNVPVFVAGDIDANDDVGMFNCKVDYRHRVFPQTDHVCYSHIFEL